jgi:nucleoside-diphosphate-sugar epimerase
MYGEGGTMENILVLGCGYLGYHMAQFFNMKSKNVVVVGNKSAYSNKLHPDIQFIESDIFRFETYEQLLNGRTTVVFASGGINATHSFAFISGDIEKTYIRFVQLLDILELKKIGRFIFLSSAGTVYGNGSGIYRETDVLEPVNIYGLQKMYFENLIRIKHIETKGIPFVIARISNPYGGYQDPQKTQGIIGILINKAIEKKPVEIWVDLDSERDYIYISDMLQLIYSLSVDPVPLNEIYNLASGVCTTLRDVIRMVEKSTAIKIDIQYIKIDASTINSTQINITKLNNVTGRVPSISLKDGISMLTKEIRERLSDIS